VQGLPEVEELLGELGLLQWLGLRVSDVPVRVETLGDRVQDFRFKGLGLIQELGLRVSHVTV